MNQILRIGGLPVKAQLETDDNWEVQSTDKDGRCVFSFTRYSKGARHEISQRTVRDSFMQIKTQPQALAFFRKYGPFRLGPNPNTSKTESAPDLAWESVQLIIKQYQKMLKEKGDTFFTFDLMSDPFSLRILNPPLFTVAMGYVRTKKKKLPSPYLEQRAFDVRTAISNSLFIDKMAGLKGSTCEECEMPILSDSDKPRRYCSDRCANTHWRRRNRHPIEGDLAAAAK